MTLVPRNWEGFEMEDSLNLPRALREAILQTARRYGVVKMGGTQEPYHPDLRAHRLGFRSMIEMHNIPRNECDHGPSIRVGPDGQLCEVYHEVDGQRGVVTERAPASQPSGTPDWVVDYCHVHNWKEPRWSGGAWVAWPPQGFGEVPIPRRL
ncbi:hypothetical protein [Gloeobacter morelensis]|uniref:hypothetical protein n=1 Tax=Gloeobacter morelensis TaxID=2907343 RepID=UPI001E4E22B9|nr:hypothetical protein [Gloeobacter morelensis]UFP97247.1 hypothetical protein ISF26_24300 [Gloeobacter morelensis MG652769]